MAKTSDKSDMDFMKACIRKDRENRTSRNLARLCGKIHEIREVMQASDKIQNIDDVSVRLKETDKTVLKKTESGYFYKIDKTTGDKTLVSKQEAEEFINNED